MNGIHEVTGSIPVSSTKLRRAGFPTRGWVDRRQAARRQEAMTATDKSQGNLAERDVAELLWQLHADEWSGQLVLTSGEHERRITIQEGRLVFATSAHRDDRLGAFLLRTGRIRWSDFAAATRLVAPGKRLGGILVERGALAAEDLFKVVVAQTRELVCSAVPWDYGSYALEPPVVAKESITLKVSTREVLLEGIRRVASVTRIERGLGDMESRFRWTARAPEALEAISFPAGERALLASLASPLSVEAICQSTALTDFETCRSLWAFRLIGLIEPADAEFDVDADGLGTVLGDA